jgi:hypothetical protein
MDAAPPLPYQAAMADDSLAMLTRQLDTAWALMRHHLDGLTTEECLWRPAPRGPHVSRMGGPLRWIADWPEHEGYDLGPPSIAWVTWHIGFWWSMAIDHSFGEGRLKREAIDWPGEADAVRAWIGGLRARWRAELERLGDGDLASAERTRWPMRERPFGDVVAWVNLELMKNAAEIGYVRFLYAVRAG